MKVVKRGLKSKNSLKTQEIFNHYLRMLSVLFSVHLNLLFWIFLVEMLEKTSHLRFLLYKSNNVCLEKNRSNLNRIEKEHGCTAHSPPN